MSTEHPDPTGGERARRAASFEDGAAGYHAARPGYPTEAVRWCVPAGARAVLDLAAGTGKLTAGLVDLVPRVIAVEPSPAMRAELTRALPQVEVVDGTATATGLPDAAVDAVTVAQAWHWFAGPAAAAEIARVLRPGGTVAILWNRWDLGADGADWLGPFVELVRRGDTLGRSETAPELGEAFGPLESAVVRWVDPVPVARLRDLAASRSHLLTLPPAAREELLAAIDELVATHPDLRGRDRVDLPYRTDCWRARAS